MVKNRTEKGNQYNDENFKLKILGVHGGDLPQFHQTNQEWWKIKENYVENPTNKSHHQVVQDNKLCSRNDLMLLADYSINEGPPDQLKVFVKGKQKKDRYTEKPNNTKRIKVNRNVRNYNSNAMRWSEQEGRAKYKGRLFDLIKKAVTTTADTEPLYSSFNKGGIFVPPPSSRDALAKQKKVEVKEVKSSVTVNSGKNTHQMSVIAPQPYNHINSLVANELNMFKRVKTSYGNREKQRSRKQSNAVADFDSTKPSISIKGQNCLSIRSGAFRP
jgi:hypothetical protein